VGVGLSGKPRLLVPIRLEPSQAPNQPDSGGSFHKQELGPAARRKRLNRIGPNSRITDATLSLRSL